MPLPSLSLPLSASTVAASLLILSYFATAERSEMEPSLVNTVNILAKPASVNIDDHNAAR